MLLGKYINKYYLKYFFFLFFGIIALILVDYFQLYLPEYLGDIIDLFNSDNTINDDNFIVIKEIIIKVIIVAFIMFLGRITFRLTIFYASKSIGYKLKDEMFLKATRLSSRYYDSNRIGNVLNYFTTDVDEIEDFLGWGTVTLVDALFLSILVLIKMFILDYVLTLLCLIPTCLIVVWGFLVEKFMSKKWEYLQSKTDRLYEFTQENFTGIRVIKAFVKENSRLRAFNKICKENKDASISLSKTSNIFDGMIHLICALITILILGFGSYSIYMSLNNNPIIVFNYEINLTTGKLFSFYGYFEILIWPMIALGQIFTMRSRAKTSLKRITNFLDEKEDIVDRIDSIELNNPKGKIEFKNFNFKYPSSKENELNNINLTINSGEKIGIVGKIGSGKTSLISALLRLYEFNDNTLFIDDIDINKIKLESLYNIVSLVPQDNFLFSDSIKNNIAFGVNKEIDFNKIKEASIFADIDSNIEEFKDKYETISGERGVTLSGGQKQRISIARAYLKDAPILIMDDSVSSVDLKTEEKILNNINNKRKYKTTIVIASRISTVIDFDKILVLDNGKIEAYGNHNELMKVSKTYTNLYYLQELEKEING